MPYMINPTVYNNMVNFAATTARDAVQRSRKIIDWSPCPDYKKQMIYKTVTVPSVGTELAVPQTLTKQISMIAVSDSYVPMHTHVRSFIWSKYLEEADAAEGNRSYETLIKETIRRMQEFEEYIVFDGAKSLAAAYIAGATGWVGSAANTATATAAWTLSTANIHQDIMKMEAELNTDNIVTDSGLYLFGPKKEMTYMKGVTSLGIPVFSNIRTSFPEIVDYIGSAYCPANTVCLIAKNPDYAQMKVGEDYTLSDPIPIDDKTYEIKIRLTFAVKVKETNAACKMTV
jgi:hypothetical protein